MNEQEPGLLTALQARLLSNKNRIKIEDVEQDIRNACQNKQAFVKYFDISISVEIIAHFVKAGFSVSENKDPFGVDVIKIGW